MVRIRTVRLGGPIVRSVKRSAILDGDVDDVSLYRDSSAAPVLDLRRESQGYFGSFGFYYQVGCFFR